jgi:hypothetical protein
MYLCVRRIDFASFYDFDIWNYSESVCLGVWKVVILLHPFLLVRDFSITVFAFKA